MSKRGRESDIAPPPKYARFAPAPAPTTVMPLLTLDEPAATTAAPVPMELNETAVVAPTSPRSLPSASSPATNGTQRLFFVTVDSIEKNDVERRMTEVMTELLGCMPADHHDRYTT